MSENPTFFIAKVGIGSLFIGPRPHAQSLKQWAELLAAENINHVVSLIENAEVDRHGLELEGIELHHLGIGLTRFPIDDFQTPDVTKFPKLIGDLSDRLCEGENLFIHCAGGVGRAGTTAACLMVKHEMSPDDAMKLVSQQRGKTSPETDEQANFVRTFQP